MHRDWVYIIGTLIVLFGFSVLAVFAFIKPVTNLSQTDGICRTFPWSSPSHPSSLRSSQTSSPLTPPSSLPSRPRPSFTTQRVRLPLASPVITAHRDTSSQDIDNVGLKTRRNPQEGLPSTSPYGIGFWTRKVLLKWNTKSLYQAVRWEEIRYGCRSFFPRWYSGVGITFAKNSFPFRYVRLIGNLLAFMCGSLVI